MKVEQQYFDVLQNIETAIVSVYEIDARLLDVDVLDALDVLIRNYALEEQGVVPERRDSLVRPSEFMTWPAGSVNGGWGVNASTPPIHQQVEGGAGSSPSQSLSSA